MLGATPSCSSQNMWDFCVWAVAGAEQHSSAPSTCPGPRAACRRRHGSLTKCVSFSGRTVPTAKARGYGEETSAGIFVPLPAIIHARSRDITMHEHQDRCVVARGVVRYFGVQRIETIGQ